MIALCLDIILNCPHCDAETSSAEATRLSTVDYEWECRCCRRFVYKDCSP